MLSSFRQNGARLVSSALGSRSSRDALADPVRQARVMAGDGVRDQFGYRLFARTCDDRKDQRRACDGMLDPNCVIDQPPLKIRVILAEVMQKSGDPCRSIASPRRSESRSKC